jgi:hypothetical protein
MPWIRVDDHYDEHPKLAAAGPLAVAMWLAGLAYCNRNLTDGFIPWSIAPGLVSWEYLSEGKPHRLYVGSLDFVHEDNAVTGDYVVALLVESGLWDHVKGGYRVHDFGQYQPTKATILAERAAKVAAGRAGGIAAATARARAEAEQALQQNASNGTADAVAKSKPVPVPDSVSNEGIQGVMEVPARAIDVA